MSQSSSGSGIRLGVVGASGRMGCAVVRFARDAGFDVVSAVSAKDVGRDVGELAGIGANGVRVTEDIGALAASGVAVCIDFSHPTGARAAADAAAAAGFALVSGTTGLDEAAQRALDAASKKVPVLWEPNMSLGVRVLGALLRRAIELLGTGFDIEIVEAHHRLKVDAPSGTALRLAEIAQKARSDAPALVHGRQGRPGARPTAEIGLHAVRGGDVIGDHMVGLLGAGERLELAHRATNRDLFAHGALRAAAWIAGKPAGRYALDDLVGGAMG
jgi:4-hydroxy-tetrahydrodipicolinate reductase